MTIFAALVGGWLTPTFLLGGTTRGHAFSVAVMVLGSLAYIWVVRHSTDLGPLVRGEARWRYRSRALRERVARAGRTLMPVDRTSAWWATRSEFAAAALAVLATGLAVARSAGPSFGYYGPSPMLLAVAGVIGMTVGLAWMVRIYRAPLRLDSTAYWRYHDGP